MDGAYAWKLAYDRPNLYAGVVLLSPDPMTLACLHVYPPSRGALGAGVKIPTVVLYESRIRPLTLWSYSWAEAERLVVGGNPNSRWWWDTTVDHTTLRDQWPIPLNYLLQRGRGTGSP